MGLAKNINWWGVGGQITMVVRLQIAWHYAGITERRRIRKTMGDQQNMRQCEDAKRMKAFVVFPYLYPVI